MMSDIRRLLATGGGLNQPNEDGVTLVRLSSTSFNLLLYSFSVLLSLLSLFLSYTAATHSVC